MLVSATAHLTKVAKITINFAQPTLFVVKRAILPENTGTNHPDHLLLMMPTTQKDLGDTRYTLQSVTTALRHPTDQAMLPT